MNMMKLMKINQKVYYQMIQLMKMKKMNIKNLYLGIVFLVYIYLI